MCALRLCECSASTVAAELLPSKEGLAEQETRVLNVTAPGTELNTKEKANGSQHSLCFLMVSGRWPPHAPAARAVSPSWQTVSSKHEPKQTLPPSAAFVSQFVTATREVSNMLRDPHLEGISNVTGQFGKQLHSSSKI